MPAEGQLLVTAVSYSALLHSINLRFCTCLRPDDIAVYRTAPSHAQALVSAGSDNNRLGFINVIPVGHMSLVMRGLRCSLQVGDAAVAGWEAEFGASYS